MAPVRLNPASTQTWAPASAVKRVYCVCRISRMGLDLDEHTLNTLQTPAKVREPLLVHEKLQEMGNLQEDLPAGARKMARSCRDKGYIGVYAGIWEYTGVSRRIRRWVGLLPFGEDGF